MISGLKDFFSSMDATSKSETLQNHLDTFQQVFDESSLKVTDGRVRNTLPAGVARLLVGAFRRMIPEAWKNEQEIVVDMDDFGFTVAKDMFKNVLANVGSSFVIAVYGAGVCSFIYSHVSRAQLAVSSAQFSRNSVLTPPPPSLRSPTLWARRASPASPRSPSSPPPRRAPTSRRRASSG